MKVKYEQRQARKPAGHYDHLSRGVLGWPRVGAAMSEQIRRYSVEPWDIRRADMKPDQSGDYVRYDDHSSLLTAMTAERDALAAMAAERDKPQRRVQSLITDTVFQEYGVKDKGATND